MTISRAAGLFVILSGMAAAASGQGRMSDKDVEALMRNLKEDAKSFRPVFQSAISKSTIRKTSREKEAKGVAELFEKKTAALAEKFKKTQKADAELEDLNATARRIEAYVVDLRLGGQVTSKWDRIHSELSQLGNAFNISEMPRREITTETGALSGAGSSAVPCLQGVGAERARKLTDECMAVSPATRPPCNAQNSCQLIIDEIKRGCRLLGQTAPIFCREYVE